MEGFSNHLVCYLGPKFSFGDTFNIEAAHYFYAICKGVRRPRSYCDPAIQAVQYVHRFAPFRDDFVVSITGSSAARFFGVG